MTVSAGMSITQELVALVGEAHVSEGSETFAIDGVVPAAVVSPASPEEVAAVLRLASGNDLIVVPSGGMTRQPAGRAPERIDILLRTGRLSAVEHYDPGDLTIGVGAGMTIAELQRVLAANDQFLPLDPLLPERATVGGVLAAASHGPLKSGYGGVRDFCIGVRFVTADGRIAKGGGRVVKNVAGYDMMKLMIGSFGTLGVITSANFKVFPRPRGTRTFIAHFDSLESAIALRDRVAASPLSPICIEIASPHAVEFLSEPLLARDPDHYAPTAGVRSHRQGRVYVRASGSDAVLARYRRELGPDVREEVEGEEEAQLWQWLSNFEAAVIARHRNAMLVHVHAPVAGVESALQATGKSAVDNNFLFAATGRIVVGALVLAFIPMAVDPPSVMQYANAVSAMRGALPEGSFAMVMRCPPEAKAHFDVWGGSPTNLEMMQAVRLALDPKLILNRARYIV